MSSKSSMIRKGNLINTPTSVLQFIHDPMSYIYNLFTGPAAEKQISKPANNAKKQPLKNDQVLRTKLKRMKHTLPSLPEP